MCACLKLGTEVLNIIYVQWNFFDKILKKEDY